jgi:spermidine synthase
MPLRVRLLTYALFLVSGSTALVYQVSWVRNLSLVFGSSFQATSIVLASFMAGLALGGFTFGRLAHRVRRPLRLFGLIEVGVAVFAFALPTLLRAVDSLYVAAALNVEGVSIGITLMRVVMAFGVLVIPTFFMGGTLPVLTHFLSTRFDNFGVRLAWLYGVNTLGAAIGALSAGFVLIPVLGVWHTQLSAVIVNLAVGLVGILVGSRASQTEKEILRAAEHREASLDEVSPNSGSTLEILPWRLVFLGVAVSGMTALSLEVMWTRGISLSVDSTTYSFTVMLAAFLIGIWLGSWLYAAFPLRRIPETVQFGIVLAAIGLSSVVASYWIPRLPGVVIGLNRFLYGDFQRIHPGAVLLAAFVVMLLPCIFMGVSFPLASQARARLCGRFGQAAGDTLALNTTGSIFGSLLAGFVLIPFLGLQTGMLLAAAVNLAYGIVVLGSVGVSRFKAHRGLVATTTVGLAAAALLLPGLALPWDMSVLGVFMTNRPGLYAEQQGDVDGRGAKGRARIEYYREGRGSTIAVINHWGRRGLLVNGKSVASETPGDLELQLLMGHVPALIHPDPRSALVVGLGAGFTLGSVAVHPEIERLVVVEIEPAVVDAAALFGDVNGHALDVPGLEIVFQDGRNYLKTTREEFDLITADPIHPWIYGATYLYTTEYYELARRRLKQGGLMCQWLPATELSLRNIKSVVATFSLSFDYVVLWRASADVLLVGSDSPIRIDLDRFTERLERPSVQSQLARLGLDTPSSLLAGFAMDDAAVRAWSDGVIINTDDNLYLEFSSPLNIGSSQLKRILSSIDGHLASPSAVLGTVSPLYDSVESAGSALGRYQWAKSRTMWAELMAGRNSSATEQQLTSLVKANRELRKVLAELPDYAPAEEPLARNLARVGQIHLVKGRPRAAAAAGSEALQIDPDHSGGQYTLGVALMRLGDHDAATRHLEQARRLRPDYWLIYDPLSRALLGAGREREAIEVLREGLALNPDHLGMRRRLDGLQK